MTTIPIPAAAIEAAAKAIYHDVSNGNPATDFPGYEVDDPDVRNHCLDMATNVLAAAFGVGEIRQQWAVTRGSGSRPAVQFCCEDGDAGHLPGPHTFTRYVLSVPGEDGWELTTAWRNVE